MKKNIFLLTLFILTTLSAVEITKTGVHFSYEESNAQSVFLAGSMNDWSTTATPMEKDKNGIWQVTLKLDSGKYIYKFIVDGNWQFDQDNPDFEDDGYDGSNSVIEIGNNGKFVSKKTANSDGVKSNFNPKVYFKGRYFVDNLFTKNGTDRFMLDKPEHDLNFGIKIKFNTNFEGYTVLNVNNNAEGTEMWKTHFNYKRTYLKMKTDWFNFTAFDNFGIFNFDNPLHIVGGIGDSGYDFGYGFRGFQSETSNLFSNSISSLLPFSLKAKIIYSDRITDNEDDIVAMRVKLSSKNNDAEKIMFGGSTYKYTSKLSDEVIQSHDNYEIDLNYTKDFQQSTWKNTMNLEFFAEYSAFENSDKDSIKSVWMEGDAIYLGVSLQFPAALKVYANYLKNDFILNAKQTSRDRFEFGTNFELDNFTWNLNGKFWQNTFPDDLNWSNYFTYVEKTDCNGRWFQEYSEVSFEKYTILGYETGFLWKSNLNYKFNVKNHQIETILKNKFAHHDLFTEPKFIENIIVLKYNISAKWKAKIDTRIPYYNDDFLGLKTNFTDKEDVFISNYSEISYHLSENVWLTLGYGVNPQIISSVTDEFSSKGRDEFLNNASELSTHIESYYGGLGENIRHAEMQLKNEQCIALRAVVTF
ncbi:MAG: hypothetical protein HN952_04665 [Candidatus Cloacimonetes bacterium]|jgi:hypothetical protein|nr:hypothetical protein [Candidatus Cloacimonadota bacterium]MBT6994232.1 hypothetical protein [Candidatus Cloacimonadota bacterium]MBT7470368.1 hypothetical protein [Candidatus Cloacimonadota bacterium]